MDLSEKPVDGRASATARVEPYITGWGRDGLVLLLVDADQGVQAGIEFVAVSDLTDLDVLGELRGGSMLLTFEDLEHRLGLADEDEWPAALVDSWRRAKRRFLKAHGARLIRRRGSHPDVAPDHDYVCLTSAPTGERLFRGTAHLTEDEVVEELGNGWSLLTISELLGQVWEERDLCATEPVASAEDLDQWDRAIVHLLSRLTVDERAHRPGSGHRLACEASGSSPPTRVEKTATKGQGRI